MSHFTYAQLSKVFLWFTSLHFTSLHFTSLPVSLQSHSNCSKLILKFHVRAHRPGHEYFFLTFHVKSSEAVLVTQIVFIILVSDILQSEKFFEPIIFLSESLSKDFLTEFPEKFLHIWS
jgi:hypothetical protein